MRLRETVIDIGGFHLRDACGGDGDTPAPIFSAIIANRHQGRQIILIGRTVRIKLEVIIPSIVGAYADAGRGRLAPA